MTSEPRNTPIMLADYAETAMQWHEAVGKDPRIANKLFKRVHNLFQVLRETPEGRTGISGLMASPYPGVALLAASHTLAWSPDEATKTLETLTLGVGLHAISAKQTLKEYKRGSLNLLG